MQGVDFGTNSMMVVLTEDDTAKLPRLLVCAIAYFMRLSWNV